MEKTLRYHQKKIFEDYYGDLIKLAFRYVGTYDQAVEITHHGFVRIFNEVTRLKSNRDAKFNGVLSARCKKIFINMLVGKIRSEPHLHISQPISEDIWQQSGIRTNVESQFLYVELIKILKGLPVTYRLVFNLYVIDGFSHAEIAKMLGIAVNDSKYNLLEAKNLIQKNFKK